MKPSIKSKVLDILHREGQIDNYYCIDNRLTIRLGDVIFRLQKEGKIELDEEKCGYLPNTKNWVYVVKPRKFRPIYVNGILVSKIYD